MTSSEVKQKQEGKCNQCVEQLMIYSYRGWSWHMDMKLVFELNNGELSCASQEKWQDGDTFRDLNKGNTACVQMLFTTNYI